MLLELFPSKLVFPPHCGDGVGSGGVGCLGGGGGGGGGGVGSGNGGVSALVGMHATVQVQHLFSMAPRLGKKKKKSVTKLMA